MKRGHSAQERFLKHDGGSDSHYGRVLGWPPRPCRHFQLPGPDRVIRYRVAATPTEAPVPDVTGRSRTFDVWLTRLDRVYRAVPFDVVADWATQGRITAADKVRPTGGVDWMPIADIPALAVYAPRAEPAAIDDAAEAFAPVELDVPIRKRRDDDDDDVDMIPLIDISLVLLIFFMMTATVAVGGAAIAVPETKFSSLTSDPLSLWVGVEPGPIFSIGAGEKPAADADRQLTEAQLFDRLRERLRQREAGRGVTVRVAADAKLPYEIVQTLTAKLAALRPLGLTDVKAEVSEKAP